MTARHASSVILCRNGRALAALWMVQRYRLHFTAIGLVLGMALARLLRSRCARCSTSFPRAILRRFGQEFDSQLLTSGQCATPELWRMETRFGDLALDIRNPDHWSEDRLLIWTGGYGICLKRLTVPREADSRTEPIRVYSLAKASRHNPSVRIR